MKKFLSLIILPIVAMLCLTGCKGDKTLTDISALYKNMIESGIIESETDTEDQTNVIFSSEETPNTIVILYNNNVGNAVNNPMPLTENQKRYVALDLQQEILNYIFNFYEKHQEDFYAKASTSEVDKKEYKDLYKKLESLKSTIVSFKTHYSMFISEAEKGTDDVMTFSIINYTYHVNNVIDSSFDFMYDFMDLYEKVCVNTELTSNSATLEYFIDKSYVDLARIIYLENIKSFNYSVGEKGICDLLALVDTDVKYSLINVLTEPNGLSPILKGNLDNGSITDDITNQLNKYNYVREVFYQKLQTYLSVISNADMYTLSQYRFNIVKGVSYDDYINALSITDRANIEMMQAFIDANFNAYLINLNNITA